mmetsp:Transcript_33084/g.53092  ORF Transcript_33084/g.53092 Transcript_33084/m.53092 type:complete len:142 (+) Transcript_33084:107-532(+)
MLSRLRPLSRCIQARACTNQNHTRMVSPAISGKRWISYDDSFRGSGGDSQGGDVEEFYEPTDEDYKRANEALALLDGTFKSKSHKVRQQRKKMALLNENTHLKHHALDCGSTEVQIASLTGRIQSLQKHVQENKKVGSCCL